MPDVSTLPYIDLAASTEELRAYSQDNFGKKISSQAHRATVLVKFATIYKDETGVDLQPIVEEPDFEEEELAALNAKAKEEAKPKPIAATIIVQDSEKDHSPVVGSVRFKSYRIVREKEVRVSIAILNSLKDAKRTIYPDPKTMIGKDILMYPFSILEYHYE